MHRSSRRSGRLVATCVALLVTGLLAACGGSDSDDTTTTAVPGEGAAAFEPVTVEHRYGSTELTERPERIVSLDPQWTDVLAALEVAPVGHVIHVAQEDETFPWQEGLLDGSEALVYTDGIPFEAVAALQPDLIVGTYAIQNEGEYRRLAELAPTIPSLTDAEVETWEDIAEVAGRLIGDESAATALVDDVDAQVAAVAEELPGLEGTTIAFANYIAGSSIVVLADPEDGANQLFAQLGMELAPGIAAEADGATGRIEISPENIHLLDGDVLLMLTNGTDTAAITGWDQIQAVQAGAAQVVDQTEAVALNQPSPLSIPWALEVIRPTLEAAAG